MPRKAKTVQAIASKKKKPIYDSDHDSDISEGGASSESEEVITDKSDLSEISDASDEDEALSDSVVSESEENITEDDLTEPEDNSDESDISDSDATNPRNKIKDEEICVHDYIGSEDDALEELETDKIKSHDLSALDYFRDYDAGDDSVKYLVGDDRVTKPYLFDYERIHLLSKRTKQLGQNIMDSIFIEC